VIQVLNSIGALTLVHAFRHGKAIVVSPMVNAGAPLLTAVIAMGVAGAMPGPYKLAGIGSRCWRRCCWRCSRKRPTHRRGAGRSESAP
jgi:hypothetical protein